MIGVRAPRLGGVGRQLLEHWRRIPWREWYEKGKQRRQHAAVPRETILIYGPKPRLVRLPVEEISKHLDLQARRTGNNSLVRLTSAGTGAGIASALLTGLLFLASGTVITAAVWGVAFGVIIGGGLGALLAPFFFMQPTWFARPKADGKPGELEAMAIDTDMGHRWVTYFRGVRDDLMQAGKTNEAVAEAASLIDPRNVEIPTGRYAASTMYELEAMDDERDDLRGGISGWTKVAIGSFVVLTISVVLSVMVFAILIGDQPPPPPQLGGPEF